MLGNHRIYCSGLWFLSESIDRLEASSSSVRPPSCERDTSRPLPPAADVSSWPATCAPPTFARAPPGPLDDQDSTTSVLCAHAWAHVDQRRARVRETKRSASNGHSSASIVSGVSRDGLCLGGRARRRCYRATAFCLPLSPAPDAVAATPIFAPAYPMAGVDGPHAHSVG